MVLISLNVNGLRAAISKGLQEFLDAIHADAVLFQETKLNSALARVLPSYHYCDWNFSTTIGYSGVAIFSKLPPIAVKYDFGSNFDVDGRILTFEYKDFFLVNVYVPNSCGDLSKWYYRLAWDEALSDYLFKLLNRKSVIVGGDFNVAHNYVDIYPENTKNLENEAGFRAEERTGFDNILELGFIDTFRYLHDEREYTWWSAKNDNRRKNRGRRLDYFLISADLRQKLSSSTILTNISISDHAPIMLEIC